MLRGLSFAGLVLALCATAARAATPAAEVVTLEGKGEYREAQQSNWRGVAPKQPLFATNYVRTLDMSRMAILFADRTQVRLSQNSTLQIKEAAGTDAKTTINLNAGRSWVTSKATPRGLTMETPSATAAIRGTEWEMAVDDEGRATLSVFSGEIEFFNDHGTVLVAANEQARAERGKAPVKLTLRTSRSRIQWVSSFTIDTRRYGDPALPEIEALVREQRLAEAYARLKTLVEGNPRAAAYLLLSDFEVYRGDLEAAERVLARGAARFAADERFDVAAARIALLSDRSGQALARANAALAKRRDSVEALIALGDIERHEGRAKEALAAYARAAQLAAKDARPWYGLGAVESERENVRPARSHLEKAIALDPTEAAYPAELGTLEGFAGNLARARESLRKALTINPDDYVALTGLGVVELKAGHTEAALDALSRAALIEPRYARAHVYLAAAHYQGERGEAALEELARAAELDPKDPLPHLLAAIVQVDRLDPGRAAESAQAAAARMPFLKSLNQVANNQKGIANVGYPLAVMGLEAWARSAAHESYLPFWGGSHLFLADRYAGNFNRRSELLQGFITDPLVFGASNRFQSLFLEPGNYATLSVNANTSDDLRLGEAAATFNGYHAERMPLAYFVEAGYGAGQPRNLDFDPRTRTVTAALGFKPSYEIGAFIYATHLSAEFDIGELRTSREAERNSGTSSRLDAGMRYAPDARSSLWIKGGAGRAESTDTQVVSLIVPGIALFKESFVLDQRRAADVGARYTRSFDERLELSAGVEAARLRTPLFVQQDETFHLGDTAAKQDFADRTDRDRSQGVYAAGRGTFGALRFETGLAWREYRKDIDARVRLARFPGTEVVIPDAHRRRKVDPMLGLAWRQSQEVLLRAACRRWMRPAASDTLMPIAIAGVPLDDQLVLPGGDIEQCRAQVEWTPSGRTFITLAVEDIETRNLVSEVLGVVLNSDIDTSNLERLRNRVRVTPRRVDLLEGTPVYAGGKIRRANAAFERIVTPTIGARVHYTYTDSENNDPIFAGLRVPYLARHQANLGVSWTPGWRVQVLAQAVYRSRRFSDESNVAPLAAGWDAQVTAFVETADKRWAVELQAANLFKKETSDIFGIVLSYRF